MKIRVTEGQIKPADLFKVIATGYAIGVGAIFGLIFASISVFVLFGAPMEGKWAFLLWPILLPIIALVQGLFIGCIATFGLTVYRWYRRIEIESGL
jgi:hypothetical protein